MLSSSVVDPLSFWYGSGSCSSRQQLSRHQQKMILLKVFCFLLFEGTFTSIFKNKKSKRSPNTVEIKIFYFFFLMME